jgi:outer membrane protein TolC
MALAIQLENRRLLMEGKDLIDKTLYETTELFKNGFVEDVVVDQIKLNQTNLDNTITAINRQIETATKYLKFQTGIHIADTIILKDSIGSLLKMIQLDPVIKADLKLNDHIDYKLVTTSEEIKRLNMKLANAAYLPTIAGFLSYSKQAMANDFGEIPGISDWYPTSLIGLNIDIPIFSSGQRMYKVQQARMALEKATNIKNATAQQLTLEAEQARTNFNTALENYRRESQNMTLANNIYQKTNQKFTEGLATSTDITTAYNQLLSTQTAYYMSIFSLLNTKINLDKALNRY